MSKNLQPDDYLRAAKALDVPVAVIRAVTDVESSGSGFSDEGCTLPKILLERHIFRRQLKSRAMPTELLEMKYPDLVNIAAGGYATGPDARSRQANEHARLDKAAKINREAALESCSWGLFQIMGYHWKALGFDSIQSFINAMYRSEGAQLDAFVKFIDINPAMHAALKKKDWAEFARRYNGPAFAKNEYDSKLAKAFAKYA